MVVKKLLTDLQFVLVHNQSIFDIVDVVEDNNLLAPFVPKMPVIVSFVVICIDLRQIYVQDIAVVAMVNVDENIVKILILDWIVKCFVRRLKVWVTIFVWE
ncbi:hypothetical protein RirG_260830 [Rhizophagus irregularis DAOM 197198w]|uniref:Uncharacterized protein n=1 Tax=Rhizophagus irregularis (strain DAOM 197198w) TaxID=1432141 RepID=A0A015J9I2_RHIIW|nr:hypothetical protein RirG_260830 [Rhizophagus irregularis DAOM 197198w]